MESAGELDWREEMLEQIKSLKDVYFSKFMELDQKFIVQKLTVEQFKSLSREEAHRYNCNLSRKTYISGVLRFLQLEKSQITETYRGQLLKYERAIRYGCMLRGRKRKACDEMNKRYEATNDVELWCTQSPIAKSGVLLPNTTLKSTSQSLIADSGAVTASSPCHTLIPPCHTLKSKSQALNADYSCVLLSQNRIDLELNYYASGNTSSQTFNQINSAATLPGNDSNTATTAIMLENISHFLLDDIDMEYTGVAEDTMVMPMVYFSNHPAAAAAAAETFQTSYSTPAPSSVSAEAATQVLGVAPSDASTAASPCGSMKSTLISTLEKSGLLAAASPREKSASPSATANSRVLPVASPSDHDSSLLHNDAAVNSCNLTNLTNILMPAPQYHKLVPSSQVEDLVHNRAETQVTKKPIDRLIAAARSLSPMELCGAVNSMWSVVHDMDLIPSRIGDAGDPTSSGYHSTKHQKSTGSLVGEDEFMWCGLDLDQMAASSAASELRCSPEPFLASSLTKVLGTDAFSQLSFNQLSEYKSPFGV